MSRKKYSIIVVEHSPVGDCLDAHVGLYWKDPKTTLSSVYNSIESAMQAAADGADKYANILNKNRQRAGRKPVFSSDKIPKLANWFPYAVAGSGVFYTVPDSDIRALAYSRIVVPASEVKDALDDAKHRRLQCSSCQTFLDEKCETYYDCPYHYECAKLGGVWEERRCI